MSLNENDTVGQRNGHALAALRAAHEAISGLLGRMQAGRLTTEELAALIPAGVDPLDPDVAPDAEVQAIISRNRTARTEHEQQLSRQEATLRLLRVIGVFAQNATALLPLVGKL